MCNHNSLSKKAEQLEKRFMANFKNKFAYKPTFHATGFDFPKWAVIKNDAPTKIDLISWGLIPYWVKDSTVVNEIRSKTLNARSETVFELPSFKTPIESKRCLVLSDGFYEWMTFNKQKYPHFIHLKKNEPFAMAGIWDEWKNQKTGDLIETFSILTCEANPLMSRIHNVGKRMPVILSPENENVWLDDSLTQNDILTLSKPFDENLMEAFTISKLISTKGANTNVEEVRNKFLYSELEMRLF
jgi:putative SOS response-associated peptidase YedK